MFASPYRFYATENNVGSMVTGSRCSGLVRSIANVHFEQIRKIYPPLKGQMFFPYFLLIGFSLSGFANLFVFAKIFDCIVRKSRVCVGNNHADTVSTVHVVNSTVSA